MPGTSFGYADSGRPSLGARSSQQQQQQQRYSFPLLKNVDILQCLHDLQIPLTEEELTRCDKHSDAIRRVFEHLVDICTGVTREEMNQPAFSGLEALSYPQLHEESIPRLAFLRAVSKMMEVCGVYDFSLRDVNAPEGKRLRRHLSAVINFAKFREDRLAMYNELTNNTDGLMEQRQTAQQENAALTAQVNELMEKTAEEAKEIEETEEECRNVESAISDLNKQQAVIRQESADLKRQGNEFKDRINRAQLALEEARAEEERLRGQIVQSPERMRREMDSASQALESERFDSSQAERELRDMQQCVANVNRADRDVAAALASVGEAEEEFERSAAAQREVKVAQDSVAGNRSKAEEQHVKSASLSRQLARFEEKLNHLRRQGKMKSDGARQRLEATQGELLELEQERREETERVQGGQSEISKLQRILEGDRAQQEAEREDLAACYRKMEQVVLSHHRSLLQALENQAALPQNADDELAAANLDTTEDVSLLTDGLEN